MLNSIEALIKDCIEKKAIPAIYYTGYGHADTGNWCFDDGELRLSEILNVIENKCKYKGKLSIFSDCSYSGNWCEDYIQTYKNEFTVNLLLVAACHKNCTAFDTQDGSKFTLLFMQNQKIEVDWCMAMYDLNLVILEPC